MITPGVLSARARLRMIAGYPLAVPARDILQVR
jgi:hypothetical protein